MPAWLILVRVDVADSAMFNISNLVGPLEDPLEVIRENIVDELNELGATAKIEKVEVIE